MTRWVWVAALLVACGRSGADKAGQAGQAGQDEDGQGAQVAARDVAPPSILALIAAEQIDSAVGAVTAEERSLLPAAAGGDPRRLLLWRLVGKPAKLVVSEPDASGRMSGESAWYFMNGELVYARGPDTRYAFSGGRLVEWTDQAGIVASSDAAALAAKEKEVKAQAGKWLKEFGR